MSVNNFQVIRRKMKHQQKKKSPLHNTFPDFQGKESEGNTCLSINVRGEPKSNVQERRPIKVVHIKDLEEKLAIPQCPGMVTDRLGMGGKNKK